MPVKIEDVIAAARSGNTALATHLSQQLQQQQLTAISEPPPILPPPTLPRFPVVRLPQPPRSSRQTLVSTQRPPADTQVTVSAAEKPVRLCYGHVRIGGEIIWVGKTLGSWVFHVRWCLGEINSFVAVHLEDKTLPAGSSITNYVGTTSQGVDSTLAALIPGYSDTLVISVGGYDYGISYSVITIPYKLMPASINFTAELQAKKVYDPRSSTTVYRTNPSLHLRDFLVQPIYAMEWAVNETSVETAADANDALVGGDKRRESGMIIETPQDSRAWIETLAGAAAVFLVVEDGAVKFVPNRPATSAGTLDLSEEIVAGSWSYQPINQRNYPTVVHVRYTDTSTTPWSEHTATGKASGVDAGTTPYRVSRLIMPWIQSHEQAYREAVEYLNGNALPSFNCSWVGADKHYTMERGDRYTLSNIPGVTGTKEVRILRNQLAKQSNGSYLFKITAREYVAGEYSDAVVSGPSATTPDIPGVFNPPAPTDVAATEFPWLDQGGTYQTIIKVTWTGVDHAHIRSYRVKIKTAANVLMDNTVSHQGAGVTHSSASGPVEIGVLHTIEVWSISSIGSPSSTPDSDTITPDGDALDPPDRILGVNVVEKLYQDDSGATHSTLFITWPGSEETWVRQYRVLITNTPPLDTVQEALVRHIGASQHEFVSVPVEQNKFHTISIKSVNIEGDESVLPGSDTIVPAGRTALPLNITNIEATEYTDYIELEWDNVLGLGDTAHRIKRGTQAQTYSTADQLDKSVFMNPDVRAEDRVIWRDYDVQSGDVRYHIKGISFEGLESAAATEVDITILTPKGSRAKERPRIVNYIDEPQWLHEDYYWINAVNSYGMVQYESITTEDAWDTVIDITGQSGVLSFCMMGFRCTSCASETMTFGGRIIIDGVTIWEEFNTLLDAALKDFTIVPVGLLFLSHEPEAPGGHEHADIDFHYIPFNSSLKIEIYNGVTGSGNISAAVDYNYFLT